MASKIQQIDHTAPWHKYRPVTKEGKQEKRKVGFSTPVLSKKAQVIHYKKAWDLMWKHFKTAYLLRAPGSRLIYISDLLVHMQEAKIHSWDKEGRARYKKAIAIFRARYSNKKRRLRRDEKTFNKGIVETVDTCLDLHTNEV